MWWWRSGGGGSVVVVVVVAVVSGRESPKEASGVREDGGITARIIGSGSGHKVDALEAA